MFCQINRYPRGVNTLRSGRHGTHDRGRYRSGQQHEYPPPPAIIGDKASRKSGRRLNQVIWEPVLFESIAQKLQRPLEMCRRNRVDAQGNRMNL